jgi:hypothetical protein
MSLPSPSPSRSGWPLASIVLATIVAPAVAQQTKVLPLSAANAEAPARSVTPFAFQFGRYQQVWHGASVEKASGVVARVSFRRDGTGPALTGIFYNQMTVTIGSTLVSPEHLLTEFKKNRAAKMTQVINGRWALPPQPTPSPLPAPFNIHFPMASPFLFDGSKGHLIMEWVMPGTINGGVRYPLDAVRTKAQNGTAQPIGEFGYLGGFMPAQLLANTLTLRLGGTLDLFTHQSGVQYNGRLVFGLSDKKFGSIQLPLDLTAIGAPGNHLYVSMDVLAPFSMARTGPGAPWWRSWFVGNIPNNLGFLGQKVFVQAYFADANANPAGLVVSNGLAVQLPKTPTLVLTNTVGSFVSTSPWGIYSQGEGWVGGPVTSFQGVLP